MRMASGTRSQQAELALVHTRVNSKQTNKQNNYNKHEYTKLVPAHAALLPPTRLTLSHINLMSCGHSHRQTDLVPSAQRSERRKSMRVRPVAWRVASRRNEGARARARVRRQRRCAVGGVGLVTISHMTTFMLYNVHLWLKVTSH